MNKAYIFATITFALTLSNTAKSETDNFTVSNDLIVSTPTKLNQSLHDTPASVTVITDQDLKRHGIKTVAEALRLVPGMAVGMTTGNNYQIAYLSPSVRATRRMQVLIDGMSVYRTGFSRVEWINIPVQINDIERIEVTRSPSSSVYGANSFEAAINIITKNPADRKGTFIEAYAGSINTVESYIGHGDSFSDTDYYVSASTRRNDGYDQRDDGENRRDETDLTSFNVRGVTKYGQDSFDYQVTGVKGELTLNNSDSRRISDSDQYIEDITLNLSYNKWFSNKHSLKIHADTFRGKHEEQWTTSYFALLFTDEMRAMFLANPSYAQTILAGGMPSGGTAEDDQLAAAVFARAATMSNPGALDNVVGVINEDFVEQRSTFSIEDTYTFSDSLRAVTGLGLSYNKLESETYLGGTVTDTLYYLFTNIEYRFSDFLLNAGVMVEQEEERINDTLVSPRVALNYHLTPTDTFRFIVSKAYRTPDIIEQSRNWNYTMRDITPPIDGVTSEALFYFQAQGSDNLVSEEILSKEISYYGVLPSIKSIIDIKLFKLELDNLIAQKISFFNYAPDNNTYADRKGVDIEFHSSAFDDIEFGFGYSYLDCESNHVFESSDLCARHSGFTDITFALDESLTMTLAYYASDNISGLDYHRGDFIVNKAFKSGGTQIDTRFIVRHYAEDHGFTVNETTVIANKYDNSTHYFAEVGVKF